MVVSSPELDLILNLTCDIYKQPNIPFPNNVDWDKLIRLASRNKFLYYTMSKAQLDKRLTLTHSTAERITQMLESEDGFGKLRRTMEIVNKAMSEEPYLLSKTQRVFPYVTHDVDIIVHDLRKAEDLFQKVGLQSRSMKDPKPLWFVDEDNLLEIEVYDSVMPGPMNFMDDDLPWKGSREVEIEGIRTHLPSIEAEVLTFFTEMNFRLYELLIGDMLHLFNIIPMANWEIMQEQAEKYGWLGQFHNQVAILNGFHRRIYQEPSPFEQYYSVVAPVRLDLPYITPFPQVAKALAHKGLLNLVKLPAYYSVRLKKHPRLHRFYINTVMNYPEKLFLRYFYH